MKKEAQTDTTARRTRKRIIWLAAAVVAAVALAFVGIKVYQILCAPQSLFKPSTMDPALLSTKTAQPAPSPADTGGASAAPTVEPTPSPTPGITENRDILNILLIGVDRRRGEEGVNKGGKVGTDPHADVQMVIAVNFKEKRVDLISILRDTFVHEPSLMPGVYKINATFNIGGGFANPDAAFQKVCEGAEYMLGGIPVDYYYAVDFDTLVKLVDAIGGVDYDVEHRSYSQDKKAGMQHMDGSDVLWYLRNRKYGPNVHDTARVNRQKEMMVAIFEQLKKNGKLSMVPDLVNAANSGVYTNTNIEQTLALANFARTIDPENITMHTMPSKRNSGGGVIGYIWYFIQEPERQELIQRIYGIDVPEMTHYSEKYAKWLDNYGFTGMVFLKNAKQVLDYAETKKEEFTEDQREAYNTLAASYDETKAAWEQASLTCASSDTNAMIKSERKMRTYATALAKLLGYKEPLKWSHNSYASSWCRDTRINEVWVDFK